jgi:hypothetical protein
MLTPEERGLLVQYCWGHLVARSPRCGSRYRMQDLGACFSHQQSHFCSLCRISLVSYAKAISQANDYGYVVLYATILTGSERPIPPEHAATAAFASAERVDAWVAGRLDPHPEKAAINIRLFEALKGVDWFEGWAHVWPRSCRRSVAPTATS